MKKAIYALLLAFLPSLAWGQESQTEYNFLRLPVSAHAAALGGENITIIEDDPSLVFSNPALAASVSDRTAGLNYMNYMSGVSYASASYTKVLAPKATVVGGVKYINYGSMKETDATGTQVGTFSANEFAIEGTLAYQWRAMSWAASRPSMSIPTSPTIAPWVWPSISDSTGICRNANGRSASSPRTLVAR